MEEENDFFMKFTCLGFIFLLLILTIGYCVLYD